MTQSASSSSWQKSVNGWAQAFHYSCARSPDTDPYSSMHNNIQGIIKGELRNDCFGVKGAMFCYAFTGSSYDGVKIGNDGLEWDIMARIKGNTLTPTKVPGRPGYYTIRPTDDSANPYVRITGSNGQISSGRAMSQFYGRLQEILNKTPQLRQYNIKLVYHGPAAQLDIYKDPQFKQKLYSVDMVPAFVIKGQHYVAKQFRSDEKLNKLDPDIWRISYSLEEKDKFNCIDKDKGCRRPTLRVCKAMRYDQPELRKLTSYHLKNALFHEMREYPDSEAWKQENLSQRVIGVWMRIEACLEQGRLGSFFDEEIDLFDQISPVTRDNIRCRIHRFCSSQNEFIKILENIMKKYNLK